MKRMVLVVSSCLATFGCAGQHEPSARMGVVGFASASDSTAIVGGTLLSDGKEYRSLHHTLVQVKGEDTAGGYHDFSVLFGPHDLTYLNNRSAIENADAGPEIAGAPDPEGTESFGIFTSAEPKWTVQAGYALMWGWWPIGYTPTVRVVTEGRGTCLVVIEKGRERIVRLTGAKTKVTVLATGTEVEINNDMHFVDVTWDANGNLQLSAATQIPPGDALEELIKLTLERKQLLTH